MVLLLYTDQEYISVSVDNDVYKIDHTEEIYSKLDKVINKTFPKASTMEEAISCRDAVLKIIKSSSEKEAVYADSEFAKKFLAYNKRTGLYHIKDSQGNIIEFLGLPGFLGDRIEKSVLKDIDVSPIIKAFIRLFRSPALKGDPITLITNFGNYIDTKYVDNNLKGQLLEKGYSDEVATLKSSFLQTPLTMEGLLCTYKVNKELTHKYVKNSDGDVVKADLYENEVDEVTGELLPPKLPDFVEDRLFIPAVMGTTGEKFYRVGADNKKKLGHIYQVGCYHYLESWKSVNTDNNTRCVPGIHAGNIDYIDGFQNSGTSTHNCFIDPSDIGAIPKGGHGDIRVKGLFIHSSKVGENRGIYHSSNYAKLKDDEWDVYVQELLDSDHKHLEEATKFSSDHQKFLKQL